MNKLTLVSSFLRNKIPDLTLNFRQLKITCLVVFVCAASANPAVRESRHAVPVGMFNGMVLVDDDMADTRNVMSDEIAIPTVLRNPVIVPPFTPDQQTEQQRLTIALGGRPYGGYYGGRPWGPYGRPWGPYGRPWGPYIPSRPWGPY